MALARVVAPVKWLCALTFLAAAVISANGRVAVVFDTNSPLLRFAAGKLGEALRDTGEATAYVPTELGLAPRQQNPIAIVVYSSEAAARTNGLSLAGLQKEGFQISRFSSAGELTIRVIARDEIGAMYGAFDLAEQIRIRGKADQVEEKVSNPRFPFRAIKFNLPWSPYRPGPATDVHLATCRDLKFWQRFLDMMAQNRFNALTLWNLHPFTYMVRPKNFPEACPFNDEELAQWRQFWRSLFRMARERGIETYLVNWNIVVSPEFARAHSVKEKNDTSELVRRYTRECVTQVINEYDDLTGLGVTLADWMNDLAPREREDWIEQTFVAGMKQARRPVKFIHRSVLAGDPLEMRRVIDNAKLADPVVVEIKFNWSHGHSTPRLAMTHDYESGKIDDRFWSPPPTRYQIAWMIRNEDFFILRWGEPGFIRDHIANNGHDYVGGYFVGSEGYIPAKDYSHELSPHQTWQYAFEKQWLFYLLWGRLLYDPKTPDPVFTAAFEERYGRGVGRDLLQAYTLASRVPLRLAAFHAATWDYTLYSEGFLAPARSRGLFDGVSPFISIDELIQHQTLDPAYVSIADFVKRAQKEVSPKVTVTPLRLADASEKDEREVLESIQRLRTKVTPYSGALECELDDLEAWANLGLYFADKLRAGVALETFREGGSADEKQKAIAYLERAAKEWGNLVSVTRRHYRETPYVARFSFAWANYQDQVERDIQIAREAKSNH